MAAKKKTTKKSKASASKTSARRKPGASKKASPRKASARKAPSRKAPARKAAPKKASPKNAGADRVAEIERVIDAMVDRGAVEVEFEEAGYKLRVRLKEEPAPVVSYAAPAAAPAPVASASAAPSAAPAAAAPAAGGGEVERPGNHHVFTSPMVGTFYRSPSPDAGPFCDVGDRVTAESTVCILEAMKVMNEIQAEKAGKIVEMLVQNGEPVEFGQPLFVIELD